MEDVTQTPEAKGLSEAERTAVMKIVGDAFDEKIETTSRRVATELVTANNIEVGNDLKPRWAVDTVRALNTLALSADGSKEKAAAAYGAFTTSRRELSDNAMRYEEKEAIRIVQSSKLDKQAQMRILSTITGAAGGFLLPKPFLAELFVTIEDRGVARRLFRGVPMTSKDLDLKDIATKPTTVWEAENAKIALTSITTGESKLTAKKLAALLNWTNEFEEDEVFGAISLASTLFGEALADKEDKAGFIGGGVSDTGNGSFTGMLNLPAATVVQMAAGKVAFDQVTFDDLSRLRYSVSNARRRNARYFVNPSIIGTLERIKGNDGQYVYRAPSVAGQPGTMWGIPVEEVEVLPGLSASSQEGSRFIAFGDPSNMLFGTRRGVSFDISREGSIIDTATAENSYSAFQQDGAILRVTERIGFASPKADNFAVLKTAAS